MVDESKSDLMAAYKLEPNNKAVRKELQLLKASAWSKARLALLVSLTSYIFLEFNLSLFSFPFSLLLLLPVFL